MKTSPKQTSLFGEEELTSLRVDFHASHLVTPDSRKVQKTSAICGQKCLEQFEKLSRPGSWAKTFAGLLIGRTDWSSSRCNLTWKLCHTKYNRSFFRLQALGHRTNEIESGLLLTPTSTQIAKDPEVYRETVKSKGWKNNTKFTSLASQVIYGMLPTPTSGTNNGIGYSKDSKQGRLEDRVALLNENGLIPTPLASDCGEKVTGLEKQDSLTKRARNMTGKTSQLNPRFVMEMMGFPPNWTELPFQNGEMNRSEAEETQ